MSHRKDHDELRTKAEWEKTQWELAKEIGLVDEMRAQNLIPPGGDPAAGGDLKDRVKAAEETIVRKSGRKAEPDRGEGSEPG